jgi:hypothetical protein
MVLVLLPQTARGKRDCSRPNARYTASGNGTRSGIDFLLEFINAKTSDRSMFGTRSPSPENEARHFTTWSGYQEQLLLQAYKLFAILTVQRVFST